MARSKALTMRDKRSIATAGTLAVILLLSKFFPQVYGRIVGTVGQTAKIDASRSSEILNGIILLGLGIVVHLTSKVLSYAPVFRQAWMISGFGLVAIGVLLIIGTNPFKDRADFDIVGYQA
tara:strand:- start:1567 stop:1929 length:363 start_codon:yes stop_codon:yes gene_type:complete